jgi:tRNA pseudouridine38-40 synthase
MSRFFITLAYNGKNYVGWQIQPNGESVQEVVQNALSIILRGEIVLVGAGRTDAGVHARKMVAHFDWNGIAFDPNDLVFKLNGFLPRDIAVYAIREVDARAHARFSASSRTYKYFITLRKDPFLFDLKYRIFYTPDIEKMNCCAQILKEYADFTSFSKLHTDVKTNFCNITDAYWERVGEYDLVFTITADRFLRNMVRAIVGTLLEVGRGRLDENDFRRIIEAKDRRSAGTSAPGYGLYLHDIVYPEWVFQIGD